jgi:glutathione S-transferase
MIKNEFSVFDRSPKGLMPWITYNGENVGDSYFCIEYLSSKLGKDLSANFSDADKSLARAYYFLVEESLRWCIIIHRFKYGKIEDVAIPWPAFDIIGRAMLKTAMGQGYGRHRKEELYRIGRKDLKALEDFVGNKRYLLGDKPCNEDASVFAFMATILYLDKGPLNEFLSSKLAFSIAYINVFTRKFSPQVFSSGQVSLVFCNVC